MKIDNKIKISSLILLVLIGLNLDNINAVPVKWCKWKISRLGLICEMLNKEGCGNKVSKYYFDNECREHIRY